MISLVVISAFILLAVIVRSFVQYKRNGDFGIRAASLSAPMIEILPGTLFVITFCLAFGVIVMGYLGKVPLLFIASLPFQVLGLAVGTCGILVTILSQIQMGDSWRIGVDQKETTTLITHGIYARSRNPIYFGILLFWVGLCLTFPHLLLWACALICWICIELIVRKIEEPYLIKVHGDTFDKYVSETNRYIPKI
ncbi:methyltransferase family protein [Brumicola blandensis]|uniref:Isoprenylcysteine carboxylmethyltransferase family protein n=1 Tax=Brumicola blandensis TaxID=3075611 RepID=A0AAW8QWN4_9ALTE|nr:isoprenylcysteine carboxylmethyltransferase family protein [Alteromonas sp. W409]MDT0581501.1 isoprenylcysteine carboxylmethyltransferase family protein [Alteromonas sp. W409]